MPYQPISPHIIRDIPSSLPSSIVKEYIEAHITNFPNENNHIKEPVFTGSSFGYTFELQRPRKMLSYSNRYSPFIQGEIIEQQTESVIHLVFSPSAQSQINFLFPILFALGSTLLVILSHPQDGSALMVIVFAYLFAGAQYSMAHAMYTRQVDKDTESIRDLLINIKTDITVEKHN